MAYFILQGITDIVIDHLRNEPAMLDTCCLVPRTWIHRARKYLFVGIEFFLFRRRVSQWRGTFLAIRSLHLTLPCFQIQIFCSFPLLEDLTLISRGRGGYGSGVRLYFSSEHASFESVPVIFVSDVVANAHICYRMYAGLRHDGGLGVGYSVCIDTMKGGGDKKSAEGRRVVDVCGLPNSLQGVIGPTNPSGISSDAIDNVELLN